ncbi:MAG: hypothetical protein GY904_00185 [Planctomycetaceae bacterium]|nr:hypothetical protein [Planctomycetaceae bacterium]
MALSLTISVFNGCSKEEVKQALDEATAKTKQLTESTVEAVEERLPENGNIQLKTNPPTEPSKQADLELIVIGDGRPNVVQIMTYDPSTSSRSYPAILLHGTTDTSTISALAGKTIQCDIYLSSAASAPIAMTKPGNSVSVTFGPLVPEDNAIRGTLGMASLIGSDDQAITILGGEILAVTREGE